MSSATSDQQPENVADFLTRLETGLKQVEGLLKEKQKDDKAIKWVTLAATIVSTIIIAGLTAFTTRRLGEQSQLLQAAAAVQNEIHDLVSEEANVRYGAERYPARTQYVDLVVTQATEFGDIDILREVETDTAVLPDLRERSKTVQRELMEQIASDKQCLEGPWQEYDKGARITRNWTLKLFGPKRLLLYRNGTDGGAYIEARRVHDYLWFSPDYSWYDRRAPVRFVTSTDCSSLDSNWGWHFYKVSGTKTSAPHLP
jgi:hypothetical protein